MGMMKKIKVVMVPFRRAGTSSSILLLCVTVLLQTGSSSIACVANLYALLLGALAVVLEMDVPQVLAARSAVLVQAPCLQAPLGPAVLHLVQSSLALAQLSFGCMIAGLVAL